MLKELKEKGMKEKNKKGNNFVEFVGDTFGTEVEPPKKKVKEEKKEVKSARVEEKKSP